MRRAKTRSLALQFPEGLLLFATTLADIFQTHCPSVEDVVILGDVTYGACCVDDYTAASLGCDFLVHYGHSCLVPVDVTGLPCLYVFVDIAFDTQHLVDCVCANFEEGASLVLAGTIQFASAIQDVRARGCLNDSEAGRPAEQTAEPRRGARVHGALLFFRPRGARTVRKGPSLPRSCSWRTAASTWRRS